jgi:hypothetical protein
MINDKDSHIPLPLIMFTCTELRYALLEWQKNKGIHPQASKSNLKTDRADHSHYFNHKNDGGKNASCCAAMGPKLLTSPGVADTYTFLMNTWNTLPESYQQRVYNTTLDTVNHQIQQAENTTPGMVICTDAASVDNDILLDYLTSEVVLEEPEIVSTDPNIPTDNSSTDNELHFAMPGGSAEYEEEGDESDEHNAVRTTSRRPRPTTELERFDLGTSDVNGYQGEDGNDADADGDEEEEASQADDGSTQNVED